MAYDEGYIRSSGGGLVKTLEAARFAADVLAEKNASDIVLLEVGEAMGITDVFVIATGRSRPHIQSLVEELKKRFRGHGRQRSGEEGLTEGEWVLLDYGDFIVHIFSSDHRLYYGLERLWGDAPQVSWTAPATQTASELKSA
ncbi:MAG: ribosome silencing factor [Actinomycetia bacterium]|nr:ribosome silencing factor [Actinomycetes bacterium]